MGRQLYVNKGMFETGDQIKFGGCLLEVVDIKRELIDKDALEFEVVEVFTSADEVFSFMENLTSLMSASYCGVDINYRDFNSKDKNERVERSAAEMQLLECAWLNNRTVSDKQIVLPPIYTKLDAHVFITRIPNRLREMETDLIVFKDEKLFDESDDGWNINQAVSDGLGHKDDYYGVIMSFYDGGDVFIYCEEAMIYDYPTGWMKPAKMGDIEFFYRVLKTRFGGTVMYEVPRDLLSESWGAVRNRAAF